MAFSSVLAGSQMVASQVSQIIDALSGTAGAGQAIVLTKLNDASAYALDVANADSTNSYGLRVQDSAGNNLLLVYKNNITVGASAANDTMTINANISGKVYIGDSANADMTAGLTINQGANDDEILAFKSSDAAHGITTKAETDTYASFRKVGAADGGLEIRGFNDATIGVRLQGYSVTADTARSTAAQGTVELRCCLKNGTGETTLGTNGNLFVIKDVGNARVVFDAEGDMHLDATYNQNVWDEYDDLALLETYRMLSAHPVDFRARFAQNVGEHTKVLADTGVITLNDDGHHFVSMKGLMGLMIDGMRQLGQRHAALRADLTEIRQKLLPEVV